MDDDRSIGDILGEALTEPMSPADWALADAIAEVGARMKAEEDWLSRRVLFLTGCALADELAPLLGCTPDDAFHSLGHMPDAMLAHLQSPQGWTLLAGYVAADLGRSAPAYAPTVH